LRCDGWHVFWDGNDDFACPGQLRPEEDAGANGLGHHFPDQARALLSSHNFLRQAVVVRFSFPVPESEAKLAQAFKDASHAAMDGTVLVLHFTCGSIHHATLGTPRMDGDVAASLGNAFFKFPNCSCINSD